MLTIMTVTVLLLLGVILVPAAVLALAQTLGPALVAILGAAWPVLVPALALAYLTEWLVARWRRRHPRPPSWDPHV